MSTRARIPGALRTAVVRASTFAALITLVAACGGSDDLAAPQGLDLGIVEFQGSTSIQAPSSAKAGDEVLITIMTSGLAGMTKGDTRVAARGMFVIVEPFDRYDGSGGGVVQQFTHEARVIFPQPGEARVTVRGRRWPENTLFSRDVVINITP